MTRTLFRKLYICLLLNVILHVSIFPCIKRSLSRKMVLDVTKHPVHINISIYEFVSVFNCCFCCFVENKVKNKYQEFI